MCLDNENSCTLHTHTSGIQAHYYTPVFHNHIVNTSETKTKFV